MIDKLDKDLCCGCAVCHDACPKKAISMVTDREGFRHPRIDPRLCIQCDICEKVCPVLQHTEAKRAEYASPQCYAVNHKNYEIRFKSTSGGVFSALAMQIYRENGYVGGAVSTPDGPKHIISNDPDDLERLRRSKYLPSDARGFYSEVQRLARSGEKALVVGTPCMIAGLRLLLKKEYDNLILVDFVCNSLNSPVLAAACAAYEERLAGSRLVKATSKSKEITWKGMTNRYDFANGKTVYRVGFDKGNIGCHLYHTHIGSRPSCTECPFKGFPRHADITLGDYWGAETHHPTLNDDMGTSLVLLNSQKGIDLFEKVKNRMLCEESKLEWARAGNPALLHPAPKPGIDRDAFFNELNNGVLLEELVERYVHQQTSTSRPKAIHKILRFIKHIRRQHKRIKRIIGLNPFRWLRFIKINFLTRGIQSNWRMGHFIFPSKPTLLEVQRGGRIILEGGSLFLGFPKQKGTRTETRVLIEKGGTLVVKGQFGIGYGSDVEVFPNATLEVETGGANCFLTLICAEKITLKGTVMMGRNVSIRDTNAHVIALEGYKVTAPVLIEDHTWLCSGCNINPGVHVGVGAIVGGMANVSCRVPAHSLALGNPAKVVMKDIMWKY